MSFSVREVSAMLGLSPSQIRAYAARGVLRPERGERGELRFGFEDLVILRTAGELAEKVPERRVRRVLRDLRERLPDEKSLTGVKLTAEGDRVMVRDGDNVWVADSGQEVFDFELPGDEVAEFPGQLRQPTAEELFDLGLDLEPISIEDARYAYQRALDLDPHHVDAHVNLGRILHEAGAPLAAEQHYRAALDIEPDHAVAIFNLGVALEDLGRLSDAIDTYQQAVALDPENYDAHYNLAGLYERRGAKAAAGRHLKICKKLH